jgi:hypothetical protein
MLALKLVAIFVLIVAQVGGCAWFLASEIREPFAAWIYYQPAYDEMGGTDAPPYPAHKEFWYDAK